MIPEKEWFNNLSELSNETVYMGNNNTCDIVSIGFVNRRLVDGKRITLTNVIYIPRLKRNLISLGVLDDSGCTYIVEKESLIV